MSSIESSATAKGRNLFYVSIQVRDEAVPVFHRRNTFEFTSLTEMEKFIRNMSLRNQHSLGSVMVYYVAEYWAYQRPSNLLERCVGLRDLTLVLCNACMVYTSSGIMPNFVQEPQAFETLLDIRGLHHVRLVLNSRSWTSNRSFEGLPAMEAAVQVMKQPRPIPQTTKPKEVRKRA